MGGEKEKVTGIIRQTSSERHRVAPQCSQEGLGSGCQGHSRHRWIPELILSVVIKHSVLTVYPAHWLPKSSVNGLFWAFLPFPCCFSPP